MRKNILKTVILSSLLAVGGSGAVLNAAVSGNNYTTCYSAGERAFAASDFVVAAENFAQALKYKPDDLRSHLKYAQALFSLSKYDESQSHLQTVLQNSPNNIIARLYLAENYAQLDKKDAAKEQLTWILNVQPNHARAKALYAEITGEAFTVPEQEKAPVETIEKTDTEKETAAKADAVAEKTETAETAEKAEKDTHTEVLYSERNDNAQKDVEKDDAIEAEIEVKDPYQSSSPVKEEKTEELVDASILKDDESMTFTPYVAGQTKKPVPEIVEKPKMPAAREDIKNTDLKSFFNASKNSFVVALEKTRYEIENGDLDSAEKTVELATKIARAEQKSRNILEAQIFKSLIMIYKCDFEKFGKNLLVLKPALSAESYQSFLDIYSQSEELKTEDDKRRLAAGVAIGAGHNAVVASLLKPVFDNNPDDIGLSGMLSEAQFHNYDYEGAGETLKKFAEAHPDNAEAQFNLARFYLTADYNPELARKYATLASELKPEDARNGIILGLTDYSEGKVSEGIARIKGLMETVEDTSLKAICQRLISDGEANNGEDASKKFIAMLALPGSSHSDKAAFRFAGEDELKAGSYFSAIDKFAKADEGVEIGRVYLGLASALTSAGEMEMAATAAGYGVKILKEEMSKGKGLSRASLYLALYNYERGDKESALASVDIGINSKDLDRSTYKKLVGLYENLID